MIHYLWRLVGLFSVILSVVLAIAFLVLSRLARTATGKRWLMSLLVRLDVNEPVQVFDAKVRGNRLKVIAIIALNQNLFEEERLYEYLGVPVNPEVLQEACEEFFFTKDRREQAAAASMRIVCLVHNEAVRELNDMYGHYYGLHAACRVPPGALADMAYVSLHCKDASTKANYERVYKLAMEHLLNIREANQRAETAIREPSGTCLKIPRDV